ncbi:type 4a pilus biogenesis protein PilO [Spiribacter vilamensis]|uniref:Pilus assembly protein PilO n=1 Tax=Spiribacter vilamensis TaxID=531306 RepID=A0A4V2GJ86_9GAMM|nr:type 4a pilus biogenesis protein PilO [Spiribacter vilamensis]RZU99265.1 pilus assembly protein PilO [Spiribacter vilamensis]
MIARALKRATLALLLGLIAGWFVTLRPVLAERDAVGARVHALDQRLEAHRRTSAGLADQRERLGAMRNAIRQHPMRLPDRPDESGLIGRITALTADSAIRLVDIAPGGTGESPRYRHRDITVRMEGPWDALMRLLARIDETTRAVALTGLELDRAKNGDGRRWLTLGLHLRGYWQPGPTDNIATTAGNGDSGWILTAGAVEAHTVAPSLRRDPFHPATRVTRVERRDIAYLGRITRGDAQWALIRDADGQLHRRRTGDPVPGLGRLTRIRPRAITVESAVSDGSDRRHIVRRHSNTDGRGD